MQEQESHFFSYKGVKDREETEDEPPDLKLEQTLRRDTDIVSMVFASCVLLVEGETELGALPLWFEHTYGVGLDEINVVLYSVGGKDNFGKVIRYLQFLQIPWVVLCDGDALDPFKGRNGRTLLTQLTEAGIEPKDMQSKDFRKQVRWLNTVGVYIFGTNYNGKFEKVRQIAAALKLAPEGTKPQQGRWVAQTMHARHISPTFLIGLLRGPAIGAFKD